MSVKSRIKIGGQIFDASSLELPSTGRTFREAYVNNDGIVEIDMQKARDIQKDVIREDRKPMLEALDVDTMKALESGADVSGIADQKQTLRDITDDPRIAAAATPEELKALTLDALLA